MRNASKLIDNRYKDLSVTDLTPGTPTLDVNIKGNTGSKYSTITKTQVNVTTSSTLLLASNTSRKYAGGFNQSGGVIYVNFGAAAVVGEGVRVTNNNPIEVPKDFTGAIYAIRNIGAGNIEMFEGT